ncbi:MAG: DNA repair protein [Oscillospiraceae bacterium]|jgi:DNA polymerase V
MGSNNDRWCLCIDLKSFYASVECVERGLDPMTTNLVVADPTRSNKTICLAVSPSMKKLGVRNRCRVFEIPDTIDYIMAPPRMKLYIDYAAEIYGLYMKYISPDDIHVYSIDEAFLDVTNYLERYKKTPKEMGKFLMDEIASEIGIRATCGIGTNLYLAKIALDILAKHAEDFIGVLDEESYCRELWDHKPLTDFWRIGHGIAARLADMGVFTMGQLAHYDEESLYRAFGIDAELMIDHAWGREPTTIADIKKYRPKSSSLSTGQVLMRDYDFEEARLIVKEMVDLECLEMVDRDLAAASMGMYIGYSNKLKVPGSKGSAKFPMRTNSDLVITPTALGIFDRIADRDKKIRRIFLNFNGVEHDTGEYQLSMYDEDLPEDIEKNRSIQKALLGIRKRFGRNAVIKGMDLEEAATTRDRNSQIGGHRSGEETPGKDAGVGKG